MSGLYLMSNSLCNEYLIMSFSSSTFIFGFLPLSFLMYFLLPSRLRKLFLFVVSLLFYGWNEPILIIYMLLLWLIIYMIGKLLEHAKDRGRLFLLILSIIILVSFLFVYKYWNFFAINVNNLLSREVLSSVERELPLGISFVVFSLISYIVDIYRGDMQVSPSIINSGLYCFHFAKISMGPIVRYKTMEERLCQKQLKINLDDVNAGFERFAVGFVKKTIIANTLAEVVDRYWNGDVSNLSVLAAWMVSVCYTLQIYYDFSGYSDMAIGIARIFGFSFEENFNYPYIAESVTDFWRRWHISLSSWFRDYVYIPLGGSRVSKLRNTMNLFAVWLLTGIWHGANWTFILWGIYYLVLLFIEKTLKLNKLESKRNKFFYRFFVFLCVNFGWVLFRAPNIHSACQFIGCMFGLNSNLLYDIKTLIIFKDNIILLCFALLFALPIVKYLKEKAAKLEVIGLYNILKTACVVIMFLVAISYCVNSTYNPFIYLDF